MSFAKFMVIGLGTLFLVGAYTYSAQGRTQEESDQIQICHDSVAMRLNWKGTVDFDKTNYVPKRDSILISGTGTVSGEKIRYECVYENLEGALVLTELITE